MDKLTMDELIDYMNKCEEDFFITVELEEESTDGEEVKCSIN